MQGIADRELESGGQSLNDWPINEEATKLHQGNCCTTEGTGCRLGLQVKAERTGTAVQSTSYTKVRQHVVRMTLGRDHDWSRVRGEALLMASGCFKRQGFPFICPVRAHSSRSTLELVMFKARADSTQHGSASETAGECKLCSVLRRHTEYTSDLR